MSGRCGDAVREQARVVSIFGGFVTLVSSGSFITTHSSPAHTKIPPSHHHRAQEFQECDCGVWHGQIHGK